MKKMNVLVVDDHAVLRLGLVTLLRTDEQMDAVNEAEDGEEAVRKALKLKPDVIIMDLMMPGLDGIAATERIVSQLPDAHVLILTSYGAADIERALAAGAIGVVLKGSSGDELLSAVRAVAKGERYVSESVKTQLAALEPKPGLTERQLEILAAAVKGYTNREIGDLLGLKPQSVKEHLSNVYAKLGAANRSEAVRIAVKRHIVG